jgi:hypothetical protein
MHCSGNRVQKLTKPAGAGAAIWLSGIALEFGNGAPIMAEAVEVPRISIEPVIPDGAAQPYAANRANNAPNFNVSRMIFSPNGVEVRQARFKGG